MLNYAVDPGLFKESLAHLVPFGTELDQFEGKTYVSLVGFRFLRTRVRAGHDLYRFCEGGPSGNCERRRRKARRERIRDGRLYSGGRRDGDRSGS